MTLPDLPGPGPPDPPKLPLPPLEVAAALQALETRVAALEDALTHRNAQAQDELARVAWAVKHGRQRPW